MATESEREPFPFVVGAGRSGTTLMRAMLAAHSEMAVPDESYFAAWLGRERARYERPDGFALDRFLQDLIAHEHFVQWGMDAGAVRAAVTAAKPETFADAVRAYYRYYAGLHGKERYGDKTPIFALHIPLLAEIFPEAVFIHMVRDGRDVALSRTETNWGTGEFEFEALQWRSQITTARTTGSKLGPLRYREVRYEQLLDDQERIAREVCAFVDLPFEPAMLDYHLASKQLVDSMLFPDEHQNVLRQPTKTRDWRQQLTPAQVALFDRLAGPTLRTFGYEPGGAPAGASVRARALWARTRYESTVLYRKARGGAWRLLHRGTRS